MILPDHLPENTGRAPANTVAAHQALDSLLGHTGWQRVASVSAPQAVVEHPRAGLDSTRLEGVALAHAGRLVDDAIPLLAWQNRPVAWLRMVGDGVVATSGAFDSWQYRDPARSTFSSTWRQIAARLSASSAPRLRVRRMTREGADSSGAHFEFVVSVGGKDSLARVRVHGDDSLPPRVWFNTHRGPQHRSRSTPPTSRRHGWPRGVSRRPASGPCPRHEDEIRCGLACPCTLGQPQTALLAPNCRHMSCLTPGRAPRAVRCSRLLAPASYPPLCVA